MCRTAASFVSARVGIIQKAPILPNDIGINRERNGGLIVVGSYVPKTTKQVKYIKIFKLHSIGILVTHISNSLQVEELKLQYGHVLKTIEVKLNTLCDTFAENMKLTLNFFS